MGWREIDGMWLYLHGGGAIGPSGPVENVTTDLQGVGLKDYQLPAPPDVEAAKEALEATLQILGLAPLPVMAPLFAAIWRAVLSEVDFAIHLAGPTGAGKSEIAALIQQHFGAAMTSRALPASWASTGNSLEVQAFAAKDALLVVDDFAPRGSRVDVQRLHKDADRLLRAQGNLAGRDRLSATGDLRTGRPPRGTILSTGEDVPGGHSLRARTVIVEVRRDALDWNRQAAA